MRCARLLIVALLVGCAPMAAVPPSGFAELTVAERSKLPERPKGSPDVLVFGISGRCGPPCQSPQDDWDALGERGTLLAVAQVFAARGLKVEVHGYAERIADAFVSRRTKAPQHGVLTLLSDYRRLTDELVVGRRNPARVVLVGHSHGGVWTHYLPVVFGPVPVAAIVELDSTCMLWSADHAALARAAVTAPWQHHPEFSPLRACEALRVGRRKVLIKDVVWPNVALDIEVQSLHWPVRSAGKLYLNYLSDTVPNVRPDGSRNGITTLVSVHEDHSTVSSPRSQALTWVNAQLAALAWLPPLPAAPSRTLP